MSAGSAAQTPPFKRLSLVSRVITALVIRESKTRFGRSRMGLVWVFIEPAAFLTFFLIVRGLIRDGIPFGESRILFLMSGLLVFRYTTAIANRGVTAISANRAMLAYPPIKPFDVILARLVFETIVMLIVVAVFFVGMAATGDTKLIVNHDNFAMAMAAATLLAFGVGFFNAVLATIWPTWERIWSIFKLPLLIMSGILYLPNSLPPILKDILWWNPLLHCVEWMRTATYLTYEPVLSKPYLLSFAMIALVCGLGLERSQRARVLRL